MTILLVEQNARAALAIGDRAYVLAEGREPPRRAAAPTCSPTTRSSPSSISAACGREAAAMNLQFVADGLLIGAMIGLGAIGVTLTYSILRFANFAHGEFIAWGAYVHARRSSGSSASPSAATMAPLGPFSFGWPVLVAGLIAAMA